MSYAQWPQQLQIESCVTDNKLSFVIDEADYSEVPTAINGFLLNMGWQVCGPRDPQTGQYLYRKLSESDTEEQYYRWDEAIAYEFYKMMTISSGNET